MKKIKTLKKNYEFKNVITKGKICAGKQIIIYICKTNMKKQTTKVEEISNRIGIAISSKVCSAVGRNYIKRKIRENYRLIAPNLKKGYDIVFLWNKKVKPEEANFNIIQKDMKKIFQKVELL